MNERSNHSESRSGIGSGASRHETNLLLARLAGKNLPRRPVQLYRESRRARKREPQLVFACRVSAVTGSVTCSRLPLRTMLR